jgi:hypothetical protein
MHEASINPGIRGQTRSTWRDETHLRGLLLRLITRHPDATRDELEAMYLAKARAVPVLVDEASCRAFDNDLARIQQPPRARPQRPAPADIAAATRRLTLALLDLIMPNGKALRDCTGRECRQAGGWLTRVADRVGDHGVVGATLDEQEIAAIFASSAADSGVRT